MVSLFFGLPGCGKTTLIAAKAYAALSAKRSKYKYVYSNVYMGKQPPFDKLIYIDKSDLGRYNIHDGLVLLDEATLLFDSRDYKNFSKEVMSFFLLHRHYNVDVIMCTQQWDGVDRKIRVITDRVFYMYKTPFFGKWISKYYRIPYGIIIPDPKNKSSGEKLGDIVQGYCKPSMLQRIFCSRLWRPKYYKYFNSWEAPRLPELPQMKALKGKEEFKITLVESDSSGETS